LDLDTSDVMNMYIHQNIRWTTRMDVEVADRRTLLGDFWYAVCCDLNIPLVKTSLHHKVHCGHCGDMFLFYRTTQPAHNISLLKELKTWHVRCVLLEQMLGRPCRTNIQYRNICSVASPFSTGAACQHCHRHLLDDIRRRGKLKRWTWWAPAIAPTPWWARRSPLAQEGGRAGGGGGEHSWRSRQNRLLLRAMPGYITLANILPSAGMRKTFSFAGMLQNSRGHFYLLTCLWRT